MRLPKQSMPVKRPDLVQPSTCVDLVHGLADDITETTQDLLFGANYNDPAAFAYRSYNQVMYSGRGGFASVGRFV
jgi:cyanobactin biosynthesis protein (PatB/AcyB/McaB family)